MRLDSCSEFLFTDGSIGKNVNIFGAERPTQGFIVCTSPPPPPPPPFLLGRGVEPPTKFSKRGSFTGPQPLEGVAGKEGG